MRSDCELPIKLPGRSSTALLEIQLFTGGTMRGIRATVFKHSHDPFIELLEEHGLEYYGVALNSQEVYASGEFLEIVKNVANATFWPSLATVIVAFLKRNNSRKVIITTEDNMIIHVEGHSPSELEDILKRTKDITAIQTKSSNNAN
jgi:hypothetical protein